MDQGLLLVIIAKRFVATPVNSRQYYRQAFGSQELCRRFTSGTSSPTM